MNLVLETCNPFNADTGYYAEQKVFDQTIDQKVFDLTFFLFGILVKAWLNEVNLSETEKCDNTFCLPIYRTILQRVALSIIWQLIHIYIWS